MFCYDFLKRGSVWSLWSALFSRFVRKQNIENENISREIHENSLIFQIFLSVLIVSPSSGGRRAKTLTGSFPFGAQQHHGHHGHHGEHHEHHGERHETQFDFGETLFLEGTYTATL